MKNNTKQVSAESGWKLIADICHKADKNELLRRALKKVANMSKKDLVSFLNDSKIIFGFFKKVVSGITLEATELFEIDKFLRSKDEDKIFDYVDPYIFDLFNNEVKNSPVKKLANYEIIKHCFEKEIIDSADICGIYEEVDFAHIAQICKRHIIKGEKLLKENNFRNLFWIRSKNVELCKVIVWKNEHGWGIYVSKFELNNKWIIDYCSFFSN